MGADPTIYCLENITDYMAFERLCNDLMAADGYTSIEPLGGVRDQGRDAIHVDESGKVTIFAYSVQKKWKPKVDADAKTNHDHEHTCDELVFVTTARYSTEERDQKIAFILKKYKLKLKLYGLDRMLVLLNDNPKIIGLHPAIFHPGFYFPPTPSSLPSRDRTKQPIGVLVADDTLIARNGLRTVLETADDIKVMGEVDNHLKILDAVTELSPDIVIIDLKWFGDETAGWTTIKKIKGVYPDVKFIAVTGYEILIREARDAGADAAMTKDFTREQLLDMIRALASQG